jgi:hypothetical protein
MYLDNLPHGKIENPWIGGKTRVKGLPVRIWKAYSTSCHKLYDHLDHASRRAADPLQPHSCAGGLKSILA